MPNRMITKLKTVIAFSLGLLGTIYAADTGKEKLADVDVSCDGKIDTSGGRVTVQSAPCKLVVKIPGQSKRIAITIQGDDAGAVTTIPAESPTARPSQPPTLPAPLALPPAKRVEKTVPAFNPPEEPAARPIPEMLAAPSPIAAAAPTAPIRAVTKAAEPASMPVPFVAPEVREPAQPSPVIAPPPPLPVVTPMLPAPKQPIKKKPIRIDDNELQKLLKARHAASEKNEKAPPIAGSLQKTREQGAEGKRVAASPMVTPDLIPDTGPAAVIVPQSLPEDE